MQNEKNKDTRLGMNSITRPSSMVPKEKIQKKKRLLTVVTLTTNTYAVAEVYPGYGTMVYVNV